ncbi:hypothetical protein BV20DRAFT_1019509 [Pilatotrama ljubarskyi]|nr:hypothetical protein BV20DRAFT_1019509 [Pilatotrama ljubarskyi]
MPFLGLFSKRDKHKAQDAGTEPSTSTASDFDSSEPDYVLPSAASAPPRSVYAGPTAASSSKLRLGIRSKKPPASRTDTNLLSPPTPNFSSVRSESDHDLLSPPRRGAVFAAYDDPMNARSTRSLPAHPTAHSHADSKESIDLGSDTPSPPVPPKHSKGFFGWAQRERKKSKPDPPPKVDPLAPLPDISVDSESFNLRSFRHVRPTSPSDSASSILPPVRPRPRGGSFASDSSQRISVAAFREAQARRSAANSPVPSSSHDALSPGSSSGLRPPSSFVMRSSARSSGGDKSNDSSSSDTDDSEDEDSEVSDTLKPHRNRTITPRSANSPISPAQKSVSELGHRTVRASPTPAPRMATTASTSSVAPADSSPKASELYSRPHGSASTSALHPNAAAQRAAVLVSQQPQRRPSPPSQGQTGIIPGSPQTSTAKPTPQKPLAIHRRSSSSSSSTSSSSSSSSDSDDAPLATLVGPRRPGSAASSSPLSTTRPRAQSRVPTKPLIDISTIATSPPLRPQTDQPPVPVKSSPKDSPVDDRKSVMNSLEKETEKEKPTSPPPTTPGHAAKPSLNDRLARLAKGAYSPTVDNPDNQDAPKEEEKERGRTRKLPARSQTQPPEFTLPLPKAGASPSPSPSPSPAPPRKPNGRSMSSPNATFEDVKQGDGKPASETPPIVPTPIRTRTPPPAFAVTSRPASQFSMLSSTTQGQSQQDQPPRAQSRTSEETVRTSRARASTLIVDGDLARNKGFTGGGLLAAAAAGSSSSLSVASGGSGGSTTRPARQRASTIVSSSPAEAPTHSPSPSPRTSPADARSRSRSNVRGMLQSETSLEELPPPRLVTHASSPDTRSISSAGPPSTLSLSPRSPPVLKSAMKQSPQPSPVTEAGGLVPRARTSSLAAFSSFPTPPKPFAGSSSGLGLRGNSPASSTGDSSSGRTPITPVDGSDLSTTASSALSAQRRGHRKSASVTFDEPERGRPGARERDAEKAEASDPEERRRRERRRSEAKAAIELGKIVNGRGPIATDDDDDGAGMENMGPRMSMFNPMMGAGMGPMGPISVTPPTPMAFTPQTPQGMFNPPGNFMFQMVPPNADPAFLAAHQQAMLAAKQAFQMAVAQQALAAANEEWERGSTATSAFGGFGMNGGMFPGVAPGFGMNMGMGLGVGGPWQSPMMFPSSQSMYAGSVIGGSELGVNNASAGRGWGSRSVYGEPTGYSGSPADRASMAFRNAQFMGNGYGSGARSEVGGPTSGRGGQSRARTRTNPSDAPLPAPHAKSRGGPPPSSWNTRTSRPS